MKISLCGPNGWSVVVLKIGLLFLVSSCNGGRGDKDGGEEVNILERGFGGIWSLREGNEGCEAWTRSNERFEPSAPDKLEVNIDKDGFVRTEGLEHFGMLHLLPFSDVSSEGLSGNNGIYYVSLTEVNDVWTMVISVISRDKEKLHELAVYEKR